MSNIYVNVIGQGTAYVDNPTPNNGDVITIFAYANPGAQLLDLTMVDQNGHSIAINVTPVQMLAYDGSWGDCTITATFSHETITVNYTAGGYAYVSNPYPADGETVTLECIPDLQHEIVDIIATDQKGNIIPLNLHPVIQPFQCQKGPADPHHSGLHSPPQCPQLGSQNIRLLCGHPFRG